MNYLEIKYFLDLRQYGFLSHLDLFTVRRKWKRLHSCFCCKISVKKLLLLLEFLLEALLLDIPGSLDTKLDIYRSCHLH